MLAPASWGGYFVLDPIRELTLSFRAVDKDVDILELTPHVEELFLSGPISNHGAMKFAKLHQLRSLHLIGSKVDDGALVNLRELKNLDHIYIEGTIKGVGLQFLNASAKNLRILRLPGNYVDDKGCAELGRFTNLEELDLSSTCITDESIKVIAGLPRIEQLDLSDTVVSDSSIPLLIKNAALKELVIRRCSISEVGYDRLKASIRSCKWQRRER